MHIRCPVCDYTRDVNLEKIPPTAEFATCPKCRHRFRFRALDLDAVERAAPPAPDPQHADVWDAVDSLHDKWRQTDETAPNNASDTGAEPADGEFSAYTRQTVAIPWENPRHFGYWQSFIKTTWWALSQPAGFFSTLSTRPSLLPALAYYLLLGIFQHVFSIIWTYIAGSMLREQFIIRMGEEAFTRMVEESLDPSVLLSTVLTIPFMLAIQLFIISVVIHVVVRLLEPGAANFALAFKVVAYSSAGLMITALPLFGAILGPVWYLALLVVGCRNAFRLSWGKTLIAITPLYTLMFLAMSAQFSQLMAL